jgi:hypothetical protein
MIMFMYHVIQDMLYKILKWIMYLVSRLLLIREISTWCYTNKWEQLIHLRFHLKFVKRKAEELETILTKGYFETSWMHLTKK